MNQTLLLKLKNVFEPRIVSLKDYEGLKVTFSANPAITNEQIEVLENFFRKLVPKIYIDFLNSFNGCELFKFEDIGGFVFFSSEELIKKNTFYKRQYGEEWQDNIIFFCECLGEGNFIGFKFDKNNKYEILDCFHEEMPSQWRVIGNSFDLFLEKLIDRGGEKFWLTE